jgi:hypothetical protein
MNAFISIVHNKKSQHFTSHVLNLTVVSNYYFTQKNSII